MKKIQQITLWVTSLVLAVISIVFISLFVTRNQKVKDYEQVIANSVPKTVDLTIEVDAIDDKEDRTIVYKNIEALNENKEILTLQDLLETKKEDFKLGLPTDFGKMVEEIKGKSKWIKAIYSEGSWWKIASPSYIQDYPDKQGDGPEASEDGDLNAGISGVYLTGDYTFKFIQVPAP